ncbi:SIMPL domain-containing protein [Clostridium sp. P21]|uniref:SIMPL domain-containing protein n=1 Tax=Clostridium muellerianum TaxID=2716538 RepID=A0A7Y0EIC9_9CLOT|nr:SIMPL domain-containing protein [Clostridium muellerianum]NMM64031.1 SIMPL domain-containing protein [Clostridium muellerianum]
MKNNNLLQKKSSLIFILTIIVTFMIGGFFSRGSKVLAADNKTSTSSEKTINVSGVGEVNVAPDIAYVSLGVMTQKESVSDAQKENSNAMNKIINEVKKQGVKSEDIKTVNYSITPKYNYDNKTGSNKLVGYTIVNAISVKVKDITKVGTIIDNAVANGANNSNGINFGVSDYEKYYNMALKNAISNANSKAKVIADSIGVKVSVPTKIIENSTGVPNTSPIYYNASLSKESTPIETGTYKVRADVSAVYQY